MVVNVVTLHTDWHRFS